MTRQEKYPDNNYFHFYNANPKNRLTSDCVIRALSTATEIPYNTVVMELAELQCKTGYDDGDKQLYNKYLESKGFVKQPQPRKLYNLKYTGREFCEYLQKSFEMPRKIVANIGGNHVVAIIDGKIHDTWDSSDGCIGNYWIKSHC